MLNNNHKNQCVWTDQLIEFIYDEMDAAQKNNFTAHLPDCVACREEISAFGGVRNSLAAYWQDEFVPLETPPIEIPPPTTTVKTLAAPSRSWLDSLRDLFAGSLAWMPTAAMAAAALVICGILAFVFLNGTGEKNQEVVQENKPNLVKKPTTTPTPQTVPTPEIAQQTEIQNGGTTTTTEKTKQNPQTTVKTVNRPQPVKVSTEKNTPVENKRPTEKVKEKVQPRKDNKKTQKKDSDLDLPDVDEEDDSLRLADMFEEIDSEE